MVISIEKKENYIIIRVNLEKINYENANNLAKASVDLIESKKPEKIAIDFSKTKYISPLFKFA